MQEFEKKNPIIKPTRCTNFSNLFLEWKSAFSDSSSIHPQEFFTIHTTMVYVIQVCRQLVSRIRMERTVPSWSCSPAVSKPVWHTIGVCTVKNSRWWTEELSETCRVSIQNKFEKLVHLVGFIIRNLSRCTVTWTSDWRRSFAVPTLIMRYVTYFGWGCYLRWVWVRLSVYLLLLFVARIRWGFIAEIVVGNIACLGPAVRPLNFGKNSIP